MRLQEERRRRRQVRPPPLSCELRIAGEVPGRKRFRGPQPLAAPARRSERGRLARSSSAHNALAWHLAWERGRIDEALPHAAEAVRDFACFECFDTLAFVQAKKGAFARAYQMQSIAVNTAPDGFSDPGMLERWEHYRRAAAQAQPAVTASAPP